MQNDRQAKGKTAEQTACLFLAQKEYEIVATNYVWRKKEIDIIAKKNNRLIFFEVKMRTSQAYGYPEEAVNNKKQENIRKVAEHFIFDTDWQHDIQFDIIAITQTQPNKPPEIYHIEDAF
ncbi:MAG: YraN family protein [Cytophagales bacterium]|nr:MAG: YraN family protein [Cytophagales bacterium]